MQLYSHTASLWGRVLQVHRQAPFLEDGFPGFAGPSYEQLDCAHSYPLLATVTSAPCGVVVCTGCNLIIDIFPKHDPAYCELMSTYWDTRIDGPGPIPPPPALPPSGLPVAYFIWRQGRLLRPTRTAQLTEQPPPPLFMTY